MNVSDGEILALAAECGVIAVRKHEFDGKQFNHTDDLLDGDAAGLVQFARLLLLKREAEAEKQEPVAWRFQSAVGGWAYGKESPIGSKYAVEPLYAAPVHAIDMNQKRVDETAKHGHEPVAWREVTGKTTHYYDYNEQGRGEPLYAAPVHEWRGLSQKDLLNLWVDGIPRMSKERYIQIAQQVEQYLKEKNMASESAK